MINLKLQQTSHSKAITEMRKTDMTSRVALDYAINFVDFDRLFFYRTPNYHLFKLKIGTQPDQVLAHYQHVFPQNPINFQSIFNAAHVNAYDVVHGDVNLTIIISLTSEAARSAMVYRKFQELLGNPGASMDLAKYELLFHNFAHTAEYLGYLTKDGLYTTTWRPLERDDYYRYFISSHYTGDRERALKILAEL